jgi:hypothetical protein
LPSAISAATKLNFICMMTSDCLLHL